MTINTTLIKDYLSTLQRSICLALESIDTHKKFREDAWQRPEGGSGKTCILEQGKVIERGGVNFSHVFGSNLPPSATAHRPELTGCQFEALGISVVVHPLNPYAPTSHMNVRFFIARKNNQDPIWWFGGGFDLTPYYGFNEDCIHWHKIAKAACDPFGEKVYARYKKWCDDYFYLKHREEPRGIGGIFFDDLNQWDFETCFGFMRSVGNHYLKAYIPILEKRILVPYTDRERNFQLFRRGRYVEFNLLYDRGTLFGLQNKGRTEAILMSLPPVVHWQYDYSPSYDSPESKIYSDYLKPREWV